MEIMRKDLNDARDLHGQAESAAAVWKASGVSWIWGTSRTTKLSCCLAGWRRGLCVDLMNARVLSWDTV